MKEGEALWVNFSERREDNDLNDWSLVGLYNEYSDFIRNVITESLFNQGIIVRDIEMKNIDRQGTKARISGTTINEKYHHIERLRNEGGRLWIRKLRDDLTFFEIEVMSFEDWFNIVKRTEIRLQRLKELGI
jgi:hypothetical protein